MVELTYLVVDGENIDTTLGLSVLNRRPDPEERPRWDRVHDYAQNLWGGEIRARFFLNASSGTLPTSFIQALLAMEYTPIPLSGPPTEKVVDYGIQRFLEAVAAGPTCNVVLATHDGDFEPQLAGLLDAGHRVAIIAFEEFLSGEIRELTSRGLQIIDLEHQVKAFSTPLPRVKIIDLYEFNPADFL